MFERNAKPPQSSTPPAAPVTNPPPPAARPASSFSPAPASGGTSSRVGAVLSSGVSITGDLTFRNELLVDGEVTGTISSAGNLTVGEHARIKADITAGTVVIHGNVEG